MAIFRQRDAPVIGANISSLRIFISRLAELNVGVPIRLLDDVGSPKPEHDWISLPLFYGEQMVEIVVFSTPTFYSCLAKVIEEAMPGCAGRKLS